MLKEKERWFIHSHPAPDENYTNEIEALRMTALNGDPGVSYGAFSLNIHKNIFKFINHLKLNI